MKLLIVLFALIFVGACSEISETKQCGRPRTNWMKQGCLQSCALTPMINRISLDARGKAAWNGAPISDKQLASYLRLSSGLNPEPITFFQNTDGKECGAPERIRRLMDANLHCAGSNRCGEGDRATWERTPRPLSQILS